MKTKDPKIANVTTSGNDLEKSAAKKTAKKEPAIDMDFLKDVTGGDRVFEKELFALFLDSAQNNISKMEKALTENNNDGWYMAAHSLKGASASIGAFPMSKALEYAQTHPKDDFKNKTNVLVDIRAELAKVAEFINQEISKA
ncbi:MAG: Hpt domain-containing protein [Pseudomonadota bacterium]